MSTTQSEFNTGFGRIIWEHEGKATSLEKVGRELAFLCAHCMTLQNLDLMSQYNGIIILKLA